MKKEERMSNFSRNDCFNALEASEYCFLIVDYLSKKTTKPISHNDLAAYLHIKKNNLSNVMDRLGIYDIAYGLKSGNKKYYFLTSKGFELVDFLENEALIYEQYYSLSQIILNQNILKELNENKHIYPQPVVATKMCKRVDRFENVKSPRKNKLA